MISIIRGRTVLSVLSVLSGVEQLTREGRRVVVREGLFWSLVNSDLRLLGGPVGLVVCGWGVDNITLIECLRILKSQGHVFVHFFFQKRSI